MWLNPEGRVWRLLIHIPVGMLNVALCWMCPALGIVFAGGFCIYEITQGRKPHLDIAGWLWGMGLAGLGLLIYLSL